MHKFVRGGLLTCCAALCGLAIVSSTPAFAAEEIALTILDTDVPLAGAEVTIFLSDGMQTAVTDVEGLATFSIDYGRGFWVEVNGDRLAQFFFVADGAQDLDLAAIGTMNWPGR